MASGKVTNKYVRSNDQEWLGRVADDYRYIGFDVQVSPGELVVYCRPRPKTRQCEECSKRKPVRDFPRRARNLDVPKTCKKCVSVLKAAVKNG